MIKKLEDLVNEISDENNRFSEKTKEERKKVFDQFDTQACENLKYFSNKIYEMSKVINEENCETKFKELSAYVNDLIEKYDVFKMECGFKLLDSLYFTYNCNISPDFKRDFFIGLFSQISESDKKRGLTAYEYGSMLKNHLESTDDLKFLERVEAEKITYSWKRFRKEIPVCNSFIVSRKKTIDITDYIDFCDKKIKYSENSSNDVCSEYMKVIEINAIKQIYRFISLNKPKKLSGKYRASSDGLLSKIKNRILFRKEWEAEDIKITYYENKWKEICQRAEMNNSEIENNCMFFEGLKIEINDVNRRSAKEKKSTIHQKFVMDFLPLIAGIAEGIALVINEEDNKPFYILTVIALIVNSLTVFAGSYIKNRASQETWLRHSLYYSKLTGEIERFCEGIGKYSRVNNKEKKDIIGAIGDFKTAIAELRTEDYSFFFTNMGCINYDPESSEKNKKNNDPADNDQ